MNRRKPQQPANWAPRPAVEADLASVVATLTAAFVSDPLVSWIVRADDKNLAAMRRLFLYLVQERAWPHRDVHIAGEGRAVAVWLPSSEPTAASSLWQQVAQLPRLFSICGLSRVTRALRAAEALDVNHPKVPPHHYLALLGCHPSVQGQGLASSLMRERLKGLDATGTPAYLETANPANIALYQRYGFEVLRETEVTSGGPKLWPMWRDPKG
jgi:ribosomal protein S18 acetylase RimI-like enzyme